MTTQLLGKMIQHFCTCVRPKLQKYKDYYDGTQAILCKTYKEKKILNNKEIKALFDRYGVDTTV